MQNTLRLHRPAPWTPVITVNPRRAAAKWVESLTEQEYEYLMLIAAEIKENTVEEVLKQIEESEVFKKYLPAPKETFSFKLVKAPSFKLI